eukprot:TRINITY_DN1084_c0_g2_i1.p1 TRINITY_DN1084_c0_g2~~TRINITY_DN1084_c0_g2_i1.p1  ORF type:complete len:444 (+),score=139.52 TRINITY_DN1084_c0_g2_i1:444-1775(+)
MADPAPIVTLTDIQAAAARLDGVAHVTPLLTCASLDVALSGGTTRFYFKAEALQRTGSFKFRGAYNAVAALVERLEGVPSPPPLPPPALVLAPLADSVADRGDNCGGRHSGLPGDGEDGRDEERAAAVGTTPRPPCWSAAALPGARGHLTLLTHSSGNHGQAVAAAAAVVGARAHIVLPAASAAVKRTAIKAYGGTITTCAAGMASRRATVERLLRSPAVAAGTVAAAAPVALSPAVVAGAAGAFPLPSPPELRVLVDPHNSADVIAGHGTLALELLAQSPTPLDALIVPVGSGSMLAGVAAAVRSVAIAPGGRPLRLFGAQPAVAAAAAASLAAGRRVPNNPTGAAATVADGLRADLCAAGWAALARGDVEEVLLVGEADIGGWMRVVWERLKVTIEPSAAVGVAAAAGERFGRLGLRHVGVVLSGGNVDLGAPLPWQRGGV